jgi:tRNA A37 N6-isopentenylltransferase MiaA
MRAKAVELKAKMEARAKQLQDIALYQMLAKDDPDMAELLKEYQDIPKV